MSDWFTFRRFALLLLAFIAAAYPEVLLGTQTFVYRDFGVFGYPIAFHHKQSFWNGEMPLWNPLNNCGVPFLAQWNTLTLYPLSIFYLVLPLSWSLAVFDLLHLYLAGLGMYVWMQSWFRNGFASSLAGLGYAFNGLSINCLLWPNNAAAWGLAPWVLWSLERATRDGGRWIVVAGLIGATQMMSGAPELILFTWCIALVVWAAEGWRSLRRASVPDNRGEALPHPDPLPEGEGREKGVVPNGEEGDLTLMDMGEKALEQKQTKSTKKEWEGATTPSVANLTLRGEDSKGEGREKGVVAQGLRAHIWRPLLVISLIAGLSAAQLFPFLDLLAHSQRDRHFGGTGWAMPGWGWANFLVPLFYSFPLSHEVFFQYEQYWVSSYYVALGLWVLALAALFKTKDRRVQALACVALLGLILAPGDDGFIYKWLRENVPLFGFVRFPIKYVALTVFVLPMLAAAGTAALEDQTQAAPARTRTIWILGGVAAALIGFLIWFAAKYPQFDPPYDRWDATWKNGLARLAFLALFLGGMFAVLRKRLMNARAWVLLQIGLLALVWLDVLTHAPKQTPTVVRSAFEAGLEHITPLPAHGVSRAMMSPSAFQHLYETTSSDTFTNYLCNRLGLNCNLNLLDGISKVDGFYSLNIRETEQIRSVLYASANRQFPGLLDFLGVSHVTAPDSYFDWKQRDTFLGFITAGQKPIFAAWTNTLRGMASTNFNPREVLYLPPELAGLVKATNGAQAKISDVRVTAHEVNFLIESDRPALASLAQSFYHPWQAYVDGVKTPLWRANHAFQALEVPAGRHSVRVRYEDRAFKLGLWISSLTAAICSFYLLIGQVKMPRCLPSIQ